MSADRRTLLRRLEGRMRQGRAFTDIRWQLIRTGMTAGDVWAFQITVRRRIREERAQRSAA